MFGLMKRRPRNQGANLTSYELNEEGIKNTIIADNTGGILCKEVKLICVLLEQIELCQMEMFVIKLELI